MLIRPVHIVCLLLICSPLLLLWHTTSSSPATTIKFWNVGTDPVRQSYHRDLLQAVLAATRKGYGAIPMEEIDAGFADGEGADGARRPDIVVAEAGSAEPNEQQVLIPHSLMRGLTGYHLLIVRAEDREKFAAIASADQLQRLRLGLPQGYAAGIWQANHFTVARQAPLQSLLPALATRDIDYVAVTATDVEHAVTQLVAPLDGLALEQSLLFYLPLLDVFYVDAKDTELARRISQGVQLIDRSGELESLFQQRYGGLLKQLKFTERRLIKLVNSQLPVELESVKPLLQ